MSKSILISKTNSLIPYWLVVSYFSGPTSSILLDHPLILSGTAPHRVSSLPYLAVLAPCWQLFQFGSGVSSYAHFCYRSGKTSSHKFGIDGASLLSGQPNVSEGWSILQRSDHIPVPHTERVFPLQGKSIFLDFGITTENSLEISTPFPLLALHTTKFSGNYTYPS